MNNSCTFYQHKCYVEFAKKKKYTTHVDINKCLVFSLWSGQHNWNAYCLFLLKWCLLDRDNFFLLKQINQIMSSIQNSFKNCFEIKMTNNARENR